MSHKPYSIYKDSGVEWLGEVPEHWGVKKLKYLFEIKKRIAGVEGYEILSITQKGIKIKDIESNDGQLAADYSNYQFVEIGDFAMNHMDLLTGYVDISKFYGVTSPDYRVFVNRNKNEQKSEYYLFLLQMCYHQKLFFSLGQGASQLGRWRLPREQFNEFIFPLPALPEQQAIAQFLDRETAKIDTLVSEQKDLIALLKEKRQALISHTVTKGLEPNVKMKDSGVEWLGEVPEHWETWKLSHAFTSIGSGTTPPSGESEWYDNGTIPWVTTGELRENLISSTEKMVTKEATEKFTALRLHPKGSLAIAMYGATIGRLGIFDIPATTNQACCVLSGPINLETRFTFYWLLGFKNIIIDLFAVGGGQPNINQEMVAGLRIPAPLIEEQQAIAQFLDHETAKIDNLISVAESAITLMQEHRSALISAAVTGKIDVRGMADSTESANAIIT